jgi:hypothetical protein
MAAQDLIFSPCLYLPRAGQGQNAPAAAARAVAWIIANMWRKRIAAAINVLPEGREGGEGAGRTPPGRADRDRTALI